jgi:hypothetical protein
MVRGKLIAGAMLLATLGASSEAAPRRAHAPVGRNVVIYTGQVNVRTADRFLETVSRNMDKVIGLKVFVDPSTDAQFEKNGYLALYDDNERQLSVSKGPPGVGGGGIEVVKNGLIDRTMGFYVIDGFFIVKSGGLHQGIVSYGLQPVDEAAVRLNPAVKLTERPF